MQHNGFTLIEMMMTIAIAVILLMLAVPSFQQIIITNRLTTQTNNLISDLALARSEAIKRGARIAVCKTNSGTNCVSGAAWGDGRLVFIDGSTAGTVDGTDTVLRYSDPFSGGLTLVPQGAFTSPYIQYTATGTATPASATGTLRLCKSGYKGRDITISTTGRVSSQETASVCP